MKIIILLTLLACAITVAAKKYHMPHLKMKWHKALNYCTTQGMTLATVKSHDEHQSLIKFAIDELDCSTSCTFWIGGNDIADEGLFTWISTGKRIRYNAWKSKQPDNEGGYENCIEVKNIPGEGWDWNWNDRQCWEDNLFVCESVENQCANRVTN